MWIDENRARYDRSALRYPSGSRAINANDADSAATRQRDWACIITNGQAENAEARQCRALNDTRAITLDNQRATWASISPRNHRSTSP